jgi:hypothetical protein
VPKEPRFEERFAFDVMQRVIGATVTDFDDNSRPGLADGLFVLPDGRPGAVEVTILGDGTELELQAFSGHRDDWVVPGARWYWIIQTAGTVSRKKLRRHLDHIVLAELSRVSGTLLVGAEAPMGYNRWLWVQTVDRAGLSGVRYHDLRHAFASALIAGGCSVKAVQHALGHTSATTTLDVYGHLWPGDEDRIRDAVDRAFAPAEDSLRTGTDGADAAPQVKGRKGG